MMHIYIYARSYNTVMSAVRSGEYAFKVKFVQG